MPLSLSGRNFLKLLDYTSDEIEYLLKLSKQFKYLKLSGTPHDYLKGKNIVLLFEKTSTRTRCAFEVAGMDLGMGVTYLDPGSSQMGKKESIADTARVLSRMYDGIEYRGFDQDLIEELAEYSAVPVWNGLTDKFHPTQMIADVLTIDGIFGYHKGIKLTFVAFADACVGISLMVVCAKLGMHFTCCAPKNHYPDPELVETCKIIAEKTGGSITLCDDMKEGCSDADVIYSDVWVALGESDHVWKERIEDFLPYKITSEVMSYAKPTSIFLHCLPSFHDIKTTIGKDIFEKYGLNEMEVTDEVFESKQSHVFEQAENRMHTIKAILYATLK